MRKIQGWSDGKLCRSFHGIGWNRFSHISFPRPQLIVLDLNKPVMNGHEFLK